MWEAHELTFPFFKSDLSIIKQRILFCDYSSGVGIIWIIVPDLQNSRERRLQLEQIRKSAKIVLHDRHMANESSWFEVWLMVRSFF